MEVLLQAWVSFSESVNLTKQLSTHYFLVDLGGSLAVASRGLFSTGVSTDLNGKFILTISGQYELGVFVMLILLGQ